MGFEYLMRYQEAWRQGGLLTPDGKLKRALLFALYTHFVGFSLADVREIDPPTPLMVFSASRAMKDL